MSSNTWICSICHKLFKTKYILNKHRKKVHGNGLAYICNLCEQKFQYKDVLRNHLRTVHFHGSISDCRELTSANTVVRLDGSTVSNDGNSNSVCSNTELEQDNQESSLLQQNNSSNTCDNSSSGQVDDGKSENVSNESTMMDYTESSCMDKNKNPVSIASDARSVAHGDSNVVMDNVVCIIPENVGKNLCPHCLKKFKFQSSKARHLKKAHNVEMEGVRSIICPECKSKFQYANRFEEHLRQVHGKNLDGTEATKKQPPPPPKETYIKCLECNIHFKNLKSLRNHLTAEHGLNMEKHELHFPNMAAFKKWKHDIERQELTSYILRHGFKKSKKGLRNEYCCHRSGNYSAKVVGERKRMIKTTGTIKLGIICTSIMACEERPDGVIIKYYPHHYGHGKELSFVHLSPQEQNAIEENVSKGIPFENLLDDIKDSQSSTDHFQLYLIKKKDARFITNAYAADEYNPGIGELESVDRWVRQCCEMENSPILFYRPEEYRKGKGNYLLIIMTEFQKQILLSAAKQVVCVDSVYRKRGGGFCLTILIVMDDSGIAFPVAFCLSNKVDKAMMLQFFTSIRESTGPLSFEYFMSDSEEFIYEAWKEVMDDDTSKWLWCMWRVDNRIRLQLRVFRGNVLKKAEAYKTMKTLLECQNVNVFESMFKNYIETLNSEPDSKNLGESISQRYGKYTHLWAYCFRKDIPLSTNIHIEVVHRTLQFVCREGRKKRLDKFLFVVMKLVKYKMLDRLCNILDDEKTELAIEAINMCHNEGLDITSEHILSLSDKIWLIEGEEDEQNIYVMREFETCPEHCTLRCKECDICVHMYTCSCLHSVINANMCPHIHAVVWKFLTPHFSPPPSPMEEVVEEQENISVSAIPNKCSDLLEEILNKSHDVYKIVRENKCNLPKESLSAILKRLNECIDIGRGKDIDTVSDAQNVLSVVLPNNVQDISQYVFVLPNNEVATIVPQSSS